MNKQGADCGVPFELLADYHDGRADSGSAERVRAHLAGGCRACEQRLAYLARLLGVLPEAVHAPQAPAGALAQARALFRERFRPPARVSLIARLAFPGGASPVPSLARGEAGGPAQLLYETDEHDLDLWAEPAAPGGWYLIGQVLPKSGAEALTPRGATLTSAAGVTVTATVEGNEYHLASVPPGAYELRVEAGDVEIRIPDISVGR